MPYGTKEKNQLKVIARQNIDFLLSFGVKAVIAACGTVSANAADVLKNSIVPVFDVLTPSVEKMSMVKGNAPLAVIATEASIRAGSFKRCLSEKNPERTILSIPCQKFVTLCETGHIDRNDDMLKNTVEYYLKPVKEAGTAALLLGCTHFGIISEAISDYLGDDTQIISASWCAAASLAAYLEKNDAMCGENGKIRFYTSGSAEEFDDLAGKILGTSYTSHAEYIPPMPIEV